MKFEHASCVVALSCLQTVLLLFINSMMRTKELSRKRFRVSARGEGVAYRGGSLIGCENTERDSGTARAFGPRSPCNSIRCAMPDGRRQHRYLRQQPQPHGLSSVETRTLFRDHSAALPLKSRLALSLALNPTKNTTGPRLKSRNFQCGKAVFAIFVGRLTFSQI